MVSWPDSARVPENFPRVGLKSLPASPPLSVILTMKKQLHISPWGVLPAGKAEEEQDFIGLFEAKANKLAPERWRLRVL